MKEFGGEKSNIKGYPLELACPFRILPLVTLENMPLVLTTLLK